eukprot:3935630-Rhodomonas_salina.1
MQRRTKTPRLPGCQVRWRRRDVEPVEAPSCSSDSTKRRLRDTRLCNPGKHANARRSEESVGIPRSPSLRPTAKRCRL